MKTTAYKYYNSLGGRISYSLAEVSDKTYDKIVINLPHGCKVVENANDSTLIELSTGELVKLQTGYNQKDGFYPCLYKSADEQGHPLKTAVMIKVIEEELK